MSSRRKQEMGHCDPWRRQDLYSKQISSPHTRPRPLETHQEDSFLVSQAHIDHLAFISQLLVLHA